MYVITPETLRILKTEDFLFLSYIIIDEFSYFLEETYTFSVFFSILTQINMHNATVELSKYVLFFLWSKYRVGQTWWLTIWKTQGICE